MTSLRKLTLEEGGHYVHVRNLNPGVSNSLNVKVPSMGERFLLQVSRPHSLGLEFPDVSLLGIRLLPLSKN